MLSIFKTSDDKKTEKQEYQNLELEHGAIADEMQAAVLTQQYLQGDDAVVPAATENLEQPEDIYVTFIKKNSKKLFI